MEHTEHLRALHTIIRDKDTNLGDFVFFSNRLSRLVRAVLLNAFLSSSNRSNNQVIEEVLNHLPVEYSEKAVDTPVEGAIYQGYDIRNITNKVFVRSYIC